VKKGTGELDGVTYEEFVYEGYGPAGVAIMVHSLTDNKNRTTADVRHTLSKYGGNLGATGCVSHMFQKLGVFSFPKDKTDEEKLMEIALEAGADDVRDDGDVFTVTTQPNDFETVKEALAKAGLTDGDAEISMIPQLTVAVTGKPAETLLKMIEALEESDDVQNVYANCDISDEEMRSLS
jgi:YebC/PmpR family DNA-binding regulatory protein